MRLLHREPDVDSTDETADTAAERTDDRTDRPGRPGLLRRRTRAYEGTDADDESVVRGRRTATIDRDRTDRTVPAETVRPRVRREYVHRPFHIGNVLTIAGGAALAVIGIVALLRGNLDSTWDQPVTTVLHIDHTPLLAAIEVGAGAVLMLLGLTGVRALALLGTVGVAIGAAVAAIQPDRLATQYQLETWWAWTVAGVASALALILLLVPSGRRKVATSEPGPV
jgi:hypothetical protein